MLWRYWLLQLPVTAFLLLVLLGLRHVFEIPPWVIAGVLVTWVGKDALLYLFVWRSYDADYPTAHCMGGRRGVAEQRIEQSGYARVDGERWHAELAADSAPIESGQGLVVESVRDLTLIVRADVAEHRPQGISPSRS